VLSILSYHPDITILPFGFGVLFIFADAIVAIKQNINVPNIIIRKK
jgi:hypothetical protein